MLGGGGHGGGVLGLGGGGVLGLGGGGLLQQSCVCKCFAIATKLRLQVGCVFFGGVGTERRAAGMRGEGVMVQGQRGTASHGPASDEHGPASEQVPSLPACRVV